MKVLFIIPTYNEFENIPIIVPSLIKEIPEAHILIVDDNSPDGTAEAVQKLQKDYPKNLYLFLRKKRDGLRKAYVEGFKWGLEKDFELFFEMDADSSHTPQDAKKILLEACKKESEVLIGSRFLKSGQVNNWPLTRKLLSYSAMVYTRLITGLPVYDPTSGFICYHRKVLDSMNLKNITCSGYGFQVEMKFVAWKLGFKLKEIPITFENRKHGVSKMNSGIILEAIGAIFKLEWLYILGKFPKKYKNSD